jgi:hypothetical protein
MDIIKKTAIVGGAIVGGIVGGTISIIGHVTKIKILDELGDSIIDSTILTGQIAGQAVSGATDLVVGGVSKKPKRLRQGRDDLLGAGGRIIKNYINNAKLVIENSGEIIDGVKQRDGKKILNGAKTMGKIVAVGFITVGAIKVKSHKENADQNNSN